MVGSKLCLCCSSGPTLTVSARADRELFGRARPTTTGNLRGTSSLNSLDHKVELDTVNSDEGFGVHVVHPAHGRGHGSLRPRTRGTAGDRDMHVSIERMRAGSSGGLR